MKEREILVNHILKLLSPQGLAGLRAMTGAHTFTSFEAGVSFRFKGNPKVNYVKVTLNGKDTFDLATGRVRAGKYTEGDTATDVHDEQLGETFRRITGLETRMPRVIRA